MLWVIGGIVVGLVGGVALTWIVIVHNVNKALSQAFGLPAPKFFWENW